MLRTGWDEMRSPAAASSSSSFDADGDQNGIAGNECTVCSVAHVTAVGTGMRKTFSLLVRVFS